MPAHLCVCRELLQEWAKEWDAPYLACSDQLQFHHWDDPTWLEWISDSLFEQMSKTMNMNITVTPQALNAAIKVGGHGGNVAQSDTVRFLVLYKYGGIYIDGDVLLLRNMQPLQHFEFMYEWSYVQGSVNTAVMGLHKGSRFAAEIIANALSHAVSLDATMHQLQFSMQVFASLCYPLQVLNVVSPKAREGVYVLPSLLFDPEWLAQDAGPAYVKNQTVLHNVRGWQDVFVVPPAYVTVPEPWEFFKGAWALHWHNQWGLPFEPRSLMGRQVDLFEKFLQGRVLGAESQPYQVCLPKQALE